MFSRADARLRAGDTPLRPPQRGTKLQIDPFNLTALPQSVGTRTAGAFYVIIRKERSNTKDIKP